jgi:hypothetical protein
MSPSIRQVLFGVAGRRLGPARWVALAVALFLGTFGAYGVGVFEISGGVVFVPGHAALVGIVAAVVVGYARRGFVAGWLVAYAALLGYRADHAFLGLSSRSRLEQLSYFLGLEGLVVLGTMALVLGSLAVGVGWLGRWGTDAVRTALATGHTQQ